MTTSSADRLSFGFLYVPLQLLDTAGPMDVLHNVSLQFVEKFIGITPDPDGKTHDRILSRSLKLDFHHIGPTKEPIESTASFLIQPTCSIDNCPPLDYLLVGGPSPSYTLPGGAMPEAMKQFIRDRVTRCKAVFATCTGAMVLAAAGVLDGQKATVNHAFVSQAREAFPDVKWDDSSNWVVDGKFWTAGGAAAGMDMVAEWARAQVGEEVIALCTMLLEYQPRDIQGRPLSYVNGRGERVTV